MAALLDEFLADMLPRQLEAERAFCNGDPELRKQTWSRRDPVTLLGAATPVRSGWD